MTGNRFIFWIARRFLLSREKDQFLSLITWVSVLGLLVGVLAMVSVTSVINGFEGELSRVITSVNGDVVLYSRGDALQNPSEVEERIRKTVPSVESITASFVTELMAAGPKGVGGAVWDGVDLDTVDKVLRVRARVVDGRFPELAGEAAIGKFLAQKLGAEVGSSIRLISPFSGAEGTSSPSSPSSKVKQLTIVGIVDLGMYQYDSKFLFSPIESVRDFTNRPKAATNFKIRLKPGADSREASRSLNQSFGHPLKAKDWRELNHNLFYAIEMEKVVIAILLTFIIIVAAFNVVSALMMLIHDKSQAISLLKAIGLSPSMNFRLFITLGLGIGLAGSVAGVTSGLIVNAFLKRVRILDLPPEVYHIAFLPVREVWLEIFLIAFLAIGIALVATLFPAWQAMRRSPLEGLRYE